MISVNVTIHVRQMLPGAQESQTITTRHRAHERQGKARDYLNEVESGTAWPQVELTGMMKAMKSGKLYGLCIQRFCWPDTSDSVNSAKVSIDCALKQMDVYHQHWQAFMKNMLLSKTRIL